MELPESIKQLTTEGPGDKYLSKDQEESIDVDAIIFGIKQKLTYDTAKIFSEGLVCPKNISSEKTFFKYFINMYSEVVVRSIRKSQIPDEQKTQAAKFYSDFVKSLTAAYDAQFDLIEMLNKNKNIIDVEEISYIMLGYAIDAIRKIYNAKAQQ
jgi:hypothetical protein